MRSNPKRDDERWVLVMESDPELQRAVATAAVSRGSRAVVVGRLQEVRESLAARMSAPAAVLIDRGRDGWRVCEALRRSRVAVGIPLVIVSPDARAAPLQRLARVCRAIERHLARQPEQEAT